MLATGEHQAAAESLGDVLRDRLLGLPGDRVVGVRTTGLWAGVDLDPAFGTGRDLCEALLAKRVLVKDTHGSTIRIAPPLVISRADLEWGLDRLAEAVDELA